MSLMNHRTTFALDGTTAARLKRLAVAWQVSQSEVVRRALAAAEVQANSANSDPVRRLRALHAANQALPAAKADRYLAQTLAARKTWWQ